MSGDDADLFGASDSEPGSPTPLHLGRWALHDAAEAGDVDAVRTILGLPEAGEENDQAVFSKTELGERSSVGSEQIKREGVVKQEAGEENEEDDGHEGDEGDEDFDGDYVETDTAVSKANR
jgi:hypothetical protein